jgi:hypothetical protein
MIMEKYLINPLSLKSKHNQIFCIDDYGVEGEITPNNWYEIITELDSFYTIKNNWGEIETYLKSRFRLIKQNLPHE